VRLRSSSIFCDHPRHFWACSLGLLVISYTTSAASSPPSIPDGFRAIVLLSGKVLYSSGSAHIAGSGNERITPPILSSPPPPHPCPSFRPHEFRSTSMPHHDSPISDLLPTSKRGRPHNCPTECRFLGVCPSSGFSFPLRSNECNA